MGAHTQHYTVLAITDPQGNKKQVEFEAGVCQSCRQVGYVRTSTVKHGVTDDERIGYCNACFEKIPSEPTAVVEPESEKVSKKEKVSSRGR